MEVAWFTPLYHAVSLARGAVFGGWGWQHLVDAVWMVAVAGVLSVIAIMRLKRTMVR